MKETTAGYIHGIIYPTDSTVASLAGLRLYLERHSGGAIRIFLVHGHRVPDSISELLFYSPPSVARSLADDGFIEACAVLKNRFTAVAALGHTVFSGRNQAAFNNFIQGQGIHEAILVDGYSPNWRDRSSFALDNFIEESGLPISHIQVPRALSLSPSGTLADLFPHGAGEKI